MIGIPEGGEAWTGPAVGYKGALTRLPVLHKSTMPDEKSLSIGGELVALTSLDA
jgi:hypothetical protein